MPFAQCKYCEGLFASSDERDYHEQEQCSEAPNEK